MDRLQLITSITEHEERLKAYLADRGDILGLQMLQRLCINLEPLKYKLMQNEICRAKNYKK